MVMSFFKHLVKSTPMKRLVLLAGLIWMSQAGHAQSPAARPDRLLARLKTAPPDTAAVSLLLEVGKAYQQCHHDSAAWYYRRAEDLSRQLGYPEGRIAAWLEAAALIRVQGKADSVLSLCRRAAGLARKHKLASLLATAHVKTASAYLLKPDYAQALSYALKGKALHEKRSDTLRMAEADRVLSVVYLSLQQYDKAITHADQAIRVARRRRHPRLLFAGLNNKGVALLKQNRFQEAQRLLGQAYPIARSLGDDHFLLICLANLGDVQMYLRNADQVLSHYRQVLALARRMRNQEGIATGYFGISTGHFMRREFPEARRYVAEARRVAEAHQLQKKLPYVYKLQSALELLDGNMAAFKKMDGQRDSVERILINESVLRHTQELEVRYQSRQQEARITRLNQEKQIQSLQLRQQNTLNYVFLGTIASLMGLGYLFYRNSVSKQIITRHNQKLQEQRIRELEQERQLIAAEAILKGEEKERSRLARDLHDGLGGMLSGIKLSLTHMAGNVILSEADALTFTRTLEQLDHSIRELRRVAHSMMPEALVKFGLGEVLRDYCDALGKSAGLPIRFQSFGLQERLEGSTEIILYRIVQELLTNVIRHAGATEALVQLMRHEGLLTLTVEDNGVGFDPAGTGKGIGLGNVLSRVNYLNGHADIVSSPGAGTSVNIQITL